MYNEYSYFGPMGPEHAHVRKSASEVKALGFGDYYNLIAIKCNDGHSDGWLVSGVKEVWDHAQLMGFTSMTNSKGASFVSDKDFEVFKRNATGVTSVGKVYMVDLATSVMYFENPCLRPGDFSAFCKTDPVFKWWGNKPEY